MDASGWGGLFGVRDIGLSAGESLARLNTTAMAVVDTSRLQLSTSVVWAAYTRYNECTIHQLLARSPQPAQTSKDPLLDEPEDHLVSDAVNQLVPDLNKTNTDDTLQSPKDTDTSTEESEDHPVFDGDGYDTDVTEDNEADDDDELDDDQIDVDARGFQKVKEPKSHEEMDEFGDAIRKHKALCYEDITLWIVKNPNQDGRDVLAMEVYFRHYKGADRKPKRTMFLFREHPLAILCPISHILARAIRDNAIDTAGYTSAEPFSRHILLRMRQRWLGSHPG
ncbi:hypothetical protein V8F06_014251 [Rhypophila decipiens]